jgi:hypothetical protein
MRMSAEKREAVTKKRISRRQMLKMIGTLGVAPPTVSKQDKNVFGGAVKYPWGTVAGATITVADKSVVSDSAGKYEIVGLAPGIYTATVKAPFPGCQAVTQNVTHGAGENEVVDFYLDFERTLVHGHVYSKDGNPIPGALVSGIMAGNDVATAVTDDKGYFRFENARPGHQFIRINAPACMTEVLDFDAKKDKETKLEFHLSPAECHISGTILDNNDRPLSAEITLSSASGVILQKTRSNAETGRYEFAIVPGTFGLLVTSPGYKAKGWRGQMSDDQKLDFRLDPEFGPHSSSSPIPSYLQEGSGWP